MARALKTRIEKHFAVGANDVSQLAATGMQLKMIVQLHMMVNAMRKTVGVNGGR